MKAKDKLKISISLEEIYKQIELTSSCIFKHMIPHNVFVSDEVKLQLINDGFKVYIDDWDGVMKNCLIIEW